MRGYFNVPPPAGASRYILVRSKEVETKFGWSLVLTFQSVGKHRQTGKPVQFDYFFNGNLGKRGNLTKFGELLAACEHDPREFPDDSPWLENVELLVAKLVREGRVVRLMIEHKQLDGGDVKPIIKSIEMPEDPSQRRIVPEPVDDFTDQEEPLLPPVRVAVQPADPRPAPAAVAADEELLPDEGGDDINWEE